MLSAIDSIQHGLTNLRGNWQLVGAIFLQGLLVSVLTLLGFLPVVLVLGFTFVRGLASQIGSGDPSALLMRVVEAGVPLILALLLTLLIWTVAFIVYCYFQGGVLGTLAAGERKARAEGLEWQRYSVFSVRSFSRFAEGLTWPVFWLVNLFLTIGLAALLTFALAMLAFVTAFKDAPGPVLASIGCLAFLVLMVILLFVGAWMQLALAELAAGTRGALAAARAALAVAAKRLPGIALLFLLMIAASLGLGIVLVPLSMVLEFGLRDEIFAYLSGQAVLTVIQWLASGFLSVAFSATLIALILGEKEASA